MNKHVLDLTLVLDEGADGCDDCVARLVRALEAREGVLAAHVVDRGDEHPELCIHYEPDVVRLDALERIVEGEGAALRGRYDHLTLPLVGLEHARHARLVEGVFARAPGVLHASVSFGTGRIYLELDTQQIQRAGLDAIAKKAGVTIPEGAFDRPRSRERAPAARHHHEHHEHDDHEHEHHGHAHAHAHAQAHGHAHDHGHHGHAHDHGGPFGEHSELAASLACGLVGGLAWGLELAGFASLWTTPVYVLSYALGGFYTVQEIAIALRARRFEIDFLMLVAALGAAALGAWAEGALLLFLFTLGHALEGFAMGRARKAITGLADLVPKTVLRVHAGVEEEVPLAALRPGDRVLVRPHTRIPADAIVVEGESSVDQAPVTGESVPVDKRPVSDPPCGAIDLARIDPAHRVFAGTVNGASPLVILVAHRAEDSTMARVVEMVSRAATEKSRTQKLTDRFERVFVPVILATVVLLLFAWVVLDEPFSASFYRAMAVLVAASPCALAIATPSAVLSGVARAARSGVLVKGGAHLETLGRLEAIAFDKTGTLTEGRPKLLDVVVLDAESEEELLGVALAVERRSDHPLAKAIVTEARARLGEGAALPVAEDVRVLTGSGLSARIGGKDVLIGKPARSDESLSERARSVCAELGARGRTVVVVRAGERCLGVLGLADTPRPEARDVLAKLGALGVRETLLLSGDHQSVAEAVAKELGVKRALGDLLPDEKVREIEAFARDRGVVAMVGDGVNDAPALARAHVGIAMGAGGSDVALEAADVALMASDLSALPLAIELGRASRRTITQNLWLSLGMVALLVPATLFGVASIGVAVALHEGSTLLVVINALRLLGFRPRQIPAP